MRDCGRRAEVEGEESKVDQLFWQKGRGGGGWVYFSRCNCSGCLEAVFIFFFKAPLFALHILSFASSPTQYDTSDKKKTFIMAARCLCAALLVASSNAFDSPIPEEVAGIYTETALAMLDFGIISADNADAYTALVAESGVKILETFSKNSSYFPLIDGVHRVENKRDLRRMIKNAAKNGQKIRVAGSQHSAPQAVFGEETEDVVKVKLAGKFRDIKVLEQTDDFLRIRVGAGANLGVDPFEPESTVANAVAHTVESLGFAFPMVGGVMEQTIGGFLMTSTHGNTVHHGVADQIESFRFMDGKGRTRNARCGTALFNAAGVSMGLYGVLYEVTFKLSRKSFNIQGTDSGVNYGESLVNSSASLKDAIYENEYFRAFWWPAADRVQQNYANAVPADTPIVPFKPEFDRYFDLTAGAILWYVSDTFAVPEEAAVLKAQMEYASSFLVGEAVPLHQDDYTERWNIGIPLDDVTMEEQLNKGSNPERQILRLQFTEMWVDLEHADAFYEKVTQMIAGMSAMERGNFGMEWYSAKASPFWMSPSYGHDVLRLDFLYWEHNHHETIREFYGRFWAELIEFPSLRLHWGKWQPHAGETFGSVTMGADFMSQRYPKYASWKLYRKLMDPDQVFVTNYWKTQMGL